MADVLPLPDCHGTAAKHRVSPGRTNQALPGPPKQCCRCDALTENAPNGIARINHRQIDDLILCGSCRVLQLTDVRTFYDCGWLRFGGSQSRSG